VISILGWEKLFRKKIKLLKFVLPYFSYAKEEFRRHKKANEAHTALFMKEWTKYYVTLSNQVGKNTSSNFLGQKMTTETLDNFTDDQLVQLHELYTELKDKS